MEKFVRLQSTINSKGMLVPLEHIENTEELKKYLSKEPDSEWYTSLYYYDNEVLTHFKNNDNSIRGYRGTALASKLVFDFDCEGDPENARKDAYEVLTRLDKIGFQGDNIKAFFSGSKGYHLEAYVNKEYTPHDLKTICSNIAGDLKTFDTVIYNTTRLYRINNTRHAKTGLYKIELEPREVGDLTTDQIKSLAKSRRFNTFTPTKFKNVKVLESYKNPNIKAKTYKSVVVDSGYSGEIRGLDTIDFKKCPPHMPRCIYALSKGVMVPGKGEREHIFFRLAKYYRNQGHEKEVTYRILKGVAELNQKLYPEFDKFESDRLWHQTVNGAYQGEIVTNSFGTHKDDELLKKYCDEVGKYTDKVCCLHGKTSSHEVVQIGEVSSSFQRFAENLDKNTVTTGIKLIDNYMKIAAGTTTLLVGACGSGKTTCALNIMENANKLGQHTMFFSLDMNKNLVYLKLAQKVTNYKQDDILNFYKNRESDKIELIRKAIAERYGKTFFDFSSTMTIEEMRDKVLMTQEKTGKDIKLVVVDYASRISGQYTDSYANARYNALKSTEVADATDAAWIYISQISRNSGDGSSPLRTKRAAKESGDWEETASNVITVWRPFMATENDNVIRMFLAKNRMGKELEMPLHWDGAKGTVKDMSEDEYLEYKEHREAEEKEVLKNKFSR